MRWLKIIRRGVGSGDSVILNGIDAGTPFLFSVDTILACYAGSREPPSWGVRDVNQVLHASCPSTLVGQTSLAWSVSFFCYVKSMGNEQ